MKAETILVVVILVVSSLLIVNILADDSKVYTYSFDTLTISTQQLNNSKFTTLNIKDCISTNEVGEPALPIFTTKILLPKGKTVESIRVLSKTAETINIDYLIIPEQESLPLSSNRTPEFSINADIYEEDDYILNKSIVDYQTAYCRGVLILLVNLYPIDYNPVKSSLLYYKDISLKVNFEETQKNQFLRLTDDDIQSIQNFVDNPDDLETYSQYDTTDYSGGICDPVDNYDFVIITNQALNDTTGYTYNWSDLLTHRANASYGNLSCCKIAYEDIDICEGYWNTTQRFNDSQAHIREFCKDAYQDWNTSYILLGGDWDSTNQIVPYRLFTDVSCRDDPEGYSYYTMPCDLYYSHLDGNWSYNDTLWAGGKNGTNDLLGELYIGRLTVKNATQISNIVEKIIYYDTITDEPWLSKTAWFAGNLNWAVASKDYMESVRLGTDAYYTYQGFEEWTDNHTAYPINTTNRYYHADDSSWLDKAKSAIDNDNASIYDYYGHSSYSSFIGLSLSDIRARTNSKPYLGVSGGCLSGRFISGITAEQVVVVEDNITGAYAVVTNTGYGWGSTTSASGPGILLLKSFWDYFFDNQTSKENWSLGRAHSYSLGEITTQISGAYQWCYQWYSSHLFGDPTMKFRLTNHYQQLDEIEMIIKLQDEGGNWGATGEPGFCDADKNNNGQVSIGDVSTVVHPDNWD